MCFELKTKIISGANSLDKLNEFKRIFIVCDPFIKDQGLINIIMESLNNNGTSTEVFAEILPDPTTAIVAEGLKRVSAYRPDAILALGGGSAIDTAKSIRLYYEDSIDDNVCLIAMPTTSGTGSEVTDFSIISDKELDLKTTIVNKRMQPDIAILDYKYTLTVPASVSANTGMDVLTHAFEAYVSTDASDCTDAFAEKAIDFTHTYLPRVVANGKDEEAREKMQSASCMAGIAFTNASLGICHSMAHALGGHFHIPHGLACALLLPHVVEFNAFKDRQNNRVRDKYLSLAKYFDVTVGSDEVKIRNFTSKLKRFIKSIGIESKITSYNIDENEFLSCIDSMAKAALKDACTRTNPVAADTDDIKEIYKKLVK